MKELDYVKARTNSPSATCGLTTRLMFAPKIV